MELDILEKFMQIRERIKEMEQEIKLKASALDMRTLFNDLSKRIKDLEKWHDIINKDHQKVVIDVDKLQKQLSEIKKYSEGILNSAIEGDRRITNVLREFGKSVVKNLSLMYSYVWSVSDNKDAVEAMRENLVELKGIIKRLEGESKPSEEPAEDLVKEIVSVIIHSMDIPTEYEYELHIQDYYRTAENIIHYLKKKKYLEETK